MISTIKKWLYGLWLIIRFSPSHLKPYYGGSQKNVFHQINDLLLWWLVSGEFNQNYYAFGLNQKARKQHAFLNRAEFLKKKQKVEHLLRKHHGSTALSYDVITKDKFVAHAFFASNGIPVVPVLGLVDNQKIVYSDGRQGNITELFKREETFVLKNVLLEAGEGFLLCKPVDSKHLLINNEYSDFNTLLATLGTSKWILQNQIQSSDSIRQINESALNTTRIMTIRNGYNIEYLCGFQAFATANQVTDSWSEGSLYVGIDIRNNQLQGKGFYHPAIPKKTLEERHPDNNILFNGYALPQLSEALNLCQNAHLLLYNSFIIGWDIVLTDDGPLLLEANELPGINAVQCINGGIKQRFHTCFASTIKEFN